jgi:sec-independent protein translocase protein TatC
MADEQPHEEELHMTFFEHLEELRARLIRSLIPFVPAFVVAWIYREPLFTLLVVPLHDAWHALGKGIPRLQPAGPADTVVVYMKQSAVVAVLAVSPWIFYQAWSFIAPGLYAREKRMVLPFVFASTLCFTFGGLFGWYYIFPPTFQALLEFTGPVPGGMVIIEDTWMLDEYVSFVSQMLFVFGVTFEVPVVIVFLSLAGIVHSRQLIKFGRWWLVVSSVLAAILTPTQDALSMLLLLGPLVGLYYVAVGFAYLIDLRRDQKAAAEAASG